MSAPHHAILALALAAAVSGHAGAQEHDPHAGHRGHGGQAGHARDAGQAGHAGHEGHAGHGGQDASHGRGPPVTPVPVPTDLDRAAAFPPLERHMTHAREFNTYLLFDRLEGWDDGDGSGQAWNMDGWAGSDLDRLWLRSEGHRTDGATRAATVELLYGRSVSPWWDVLAGIRHDVAPGRSRQWLAVGVQGLAPYMVEVTATAYLGESGRGMLGVELEYDLLLGNRLILQPVLEATVHGQADPGRGIGTGLSTVDAGMRLRYEVHRQFAPYVGLVHERSFGDTATLRAAAGKATRDTQLVAGVRIWF